MIWKKLLLSLVALVAVALLAEGVAFLLYRYPGDNPVLRHAVTQFYLTRDSRAIQYEPESGAYDPELFYVLRPGTFAFRNREFSTTVRINSQGFRDDEASLIAPEIVVLGDSYAMGWGVEDDETFAHRLQELSGMRVLNTGVPSYGTVRELRVLKRLDLSAARYIILQYCKNDVVETMRFMHDGNQLKILPPQDYRHAVNWNDGRSRDKHMPFRFLRTFLPEVGKAARTKKHWSPPPNETAQQKWNIHLRDSHHFINAFQELPRLDVDLSGKKVIILELSSWYPDIGLFTDVLQAQQEQGSFPPGFAELDLHLVDVYATLTRDDYFVLDDHIKASGHEKVAQVLWNFIRQQERGGAE